jgi:hypothetical protein
MVMRDFVSGALNLKILIKVKYIILRYGRQGLEMGAADSSLRPCTSLEKLRGVKLRGSSFKKMAKVTSRRLHFQTRRRRKSRSLVHKIVMWCYITSFTLYAQRNCVMKLGDFGGQET